MSIKVLEHEGIYTVYRFVVRRGAGGKLFESASPIDIPFPPPVTLLNLDSIGQLTKWAEELDEDQLEVALQIFYDKWMFQKDQRDFHTTYTVLYDERARRHKLKKERIPKAIK